MLKLLLDDLAEVQPLPHVQNLTRAPFLSLIGSDREGS